MYISNQIKINASRDKVFEFLEEFENIPLWNYYVKEVRRIPGDNSINQYYQERKNDYQVFETLNVDHPRAISIATLDGTPIQFKRSFHLEANGIDSCILQDAFEIDNGMPKVIQSILRTKVKSAVWENLGKLKELIETGQTILQDGRVSTYKI